MSESQLRLSRPRDPVTSEQACAGTVCGRRVVLHQRDQGASGCCEVFTVKTSEPKNFGTSAELRLLARDYVPTPLVQLEGQ